MSNVCKKADIDKRTNHSGRKKNTFKRLREADIEFAHIVQLTGHKNIQSVNSYSDVSVKNNKGKCLKF